VNDISIHKIATQHTKPQGFNIRSPLLTTNKGYAYIYFINHYLSASLLQPSGVKHDMCDRLSHINEYNAQHEDHKYKLKI
jgi:hypothetical protein